MAFYIIFESRGMNCIICFMCADNANNAIFLRLLTGKQNAMIKIGKKIKINL